MTSNQFLDKLKTAETTCGLYLFHYVQFEEREKAFEIFNSDLFPWDTKPKLYGEALQQHAFYFRRNARSKGVRDNEALSLLEEMCKKIEEDFDVKIFDVYCNRFEDPTHNQEWHKDTYGSHIFVLSLGSQRTVEWRENKSGAIDSVRPAAGDMYFMPLGLNKTHEHRVCTGKEGDGTRISFVFFFKSPKYAKEFKISLLDKMTGFVEDALSNPS
eukprot:CAMPEP_0194218242 /NCGR_PEP_ID=MMETSP0156-20130528/23321_1 /TAXON_ID=33649 /ORGANISM="Thalassionema nitzschioides, Strain L26-B" /LENGTH=213 /DNA_ID=CAMNT_0038947527 /DNA_START=7 /DNA_END=648 /DNA_ORIENTATION=+